MKLLYIIMLQIVEKSQKFIFGLVKHEKFSRCLPRMLGITGLILGLHPVNERRRYKVTPSHWLGANLDSALDMIFNCA